MICFNLMHSNFPSRYSQDNICQLFCTLYIIQVKFDHIPRATVGPDEPHAANTAWPDGVLEKQDLDISYPEREQLNLNGFLSSELPSHPKLYRGQLKNGLRYLILPNKVPPNRYGSYTTVHLVNFFLNFFYSFLKMKCSSKLYLGGVEKFYFEKVWF